jgi:hypothetical protein
MRILILEILGTWVLLGVLTTALFHQAIKTGRRYDLTYN